MTIDSVLLAKLPPEAREAYEAAVKKAKAGDDYELRVFVALRDYPVSIEQFIEDPDYLGSDSVYPAIRKELIELNNPPQPGCKFRARLFTTYSEAVLTGAIGTGKTTLALYSLAYQVFVLSCFHSPHVLFNLDPTSEIVFVIQNKTERLAKVVDYERFRAMIEAAPYFHERFPFDKKVKSELRFPNRIVVKPAAGTGDAFIGHNVFGGIVDEINFMDSVPHSKRSPDGAEYDQAMTLYQSIARRRKSRFMKYGRVPGLLFLVSSRRFPGQFTDLKEEERRKQLAETGTTSIYLFDKRLWEIKPPGGTYSGATFRVFSGDAARKPRILEDAEIVPTADERLVMAIPVEHRDEFDADIYSALRDIAGMSAVSIHPFLTNRDAVAACFGTHESIFDRDTVTFPDQTLTGNSHRFYCPELIRWVHLDLSLTINSTGFVMGCVPRFERIERGSAVERLPRIRIDFVLEVRPPKDGEVPYEIIRKIIYNLRESGLNICFVTADRFQSADTLQILRHQEFTTGTFSPDQTPEAYEWLRSALNDRRVDIPAHDKLQQELLNLERDAKTGKVQHPPNGSKDLADALASVVYGLTMRRDVWSQHDVRPEEHAPEEILRPYELTAEPTTNF